MEAVRERTQFVGSSGEGVAIGPRREGENPQTLGLAQVVVTPRGKLDLDSGMTNAYVWRAGPNKGMVAIRRAAYEKGHEVAFDGRSNYVHQIDFLAVTEESPPEAAASLVAYALRAIGGIRLFVVDVEGETAKQLFEGLSFVRMCGRNGRARYGYLPETPESELPLRLPERVLARPEFLARLSPRERAYHDGLRTRTGFDIVEFIKSGWTSYECYGNRFFFLLTFGTTSEPPQPAFRIDMFDLRDGAIIAHADVLVSRTSDFSLQDEAVTGLSAKLPDAATRVLKDAPRLNTDGASRIREGWPPREGIWVRQDYRRAGIGQSLERIAGDVCKLAFCGIKTVGVIFPERNLEAYTFHKKAGARDVRDPLYCLEYRLDAVDRPVIRILYGL